MIMKTTTALFLASSFASFVLPQAIDPTSVDQATKCESLSRFILETFVLMLIRTSQMVS